MKELLKEIRELKSNRSVRVGSKWVSTLHLKCMDHEFLLRSVKERRKMPESIGMALIYLLKNGYIQLKPTCAGHEFANQVLEEYNWEERRKHDMVAERRRMRSVVQRSKFELDKITSRKDSSIIYGHYDSIQVEAFTYGRYVKLRKGDIMTFVGSGKLYNKLLNDITTALRSPKGRLWLVKAGVGHLERYLRLEDTLRDGGS